MRRKFVAAAAAFVCLCAPSFAGEPLFSRVYTTDTEPAGHIEIEQVVRNRNSRSMGTYNAFDFRTEFEIGVTDDFQASLYVNNLMMHAKGAPDDDDPLGATGFRRTGTYFQGLSMEFIYRLYSPYKDGFGLAFYLEPEFGAHDLHDGLAYSGTVGGEYRIIFQKNFLDDQLIFTYNLVLETEGIRFKGEKRYTGELDFNNEVGLAYRFAPNWFAGIEGRNHNEYGQFHKFEHSVYWAGPAIHYGGERFWATLGYLRQVYGSPHGIDENGTPVGRNLFLRSHERNEITLKVGYAF
ncbi:DUF6662 family protein [Methylobacterium persicinum]|uniref:Uncharacterized protein n=1 Tax=Methylobacterium persicinum TaxID=374426 RepID=A0ABU0HKQ7_9HYPH|nr:DUF6662 family protein [Methylobacterium persicinum]MDQ0442899.1 hypothetical protein [Methylobacterium persicinum]GJE37353.1 hypothetical protein KHHGKMAE_1409 [Methylobacterium persicinum]